MNCIWWFTLLVTRLKSTVSFNSVTATPDFHFPFHSLRAYSFFLNSTLLPLRRVSFLLLFFSLLDEGRLARI